MAGWDMTQENQARQHTSVQNDISAVNCYTQVQRVESLSEASKEEFPIVGRAQARFPGVS